MPAHKDISGSVIHGVQVVSVDGINHRHSYQYKCICHCGKPFVVDGDKLKRGWTRSCGCLLESIKHGRVNTPEYGIWAAMKRRCMNKSSPAFADYGGRGISVCERWLDFKNFFADMGPRPSNKHSIDRIDNNGNYGPENVRWSTMHDQCRNRRNNKLLTVSGRTMCISDWADELGMQSSTLYRRIKVGWSVDRAINTPLRPMRAKDH